MVIDAARQLHDTTSAALTTTATTIQQPRINLDDANQAKEDDHDDEENKKEDEIIDELQNRDDDEWAIDEYKTIPEAEFTATLSALNSPRRVGEPNTILLTDNEVPEIERPLDTDDEEDEDDEEHGGGKW